MDQAPRTDGVGKCSAPKPCAAGTWASLFASMKFRNWVFVFAVSAVGSMCAAVVNSLFAIRSASVLAQSEDRHRLEDEVINKKRAEVSAQQSLSSAKMVADAILLAGQKNTNNPPVADSVHKPMMIVLIICMSVMMSILLWICFRLYQDKKKKTTK